MLFARWSEARDAAVRLREEASAAASAVETHTREAAAATTRAAQAEEAIKPLREAETIAAAILHRLAIDKDRLDLSERQAVEYWMKRWGVTKDQITAAHRKVGRMTKDIAAELGKKR